MTARKRLDWSRRPGEAGRASRSHSVRASRPRRRMAHPGHQRRPIRGTDRCHRMAHRLGPGRVQAPEFLPRAGAGGLRRPATGGTRPTSFGTRKLGNRLRSPRWAPGSNTGMTRNRAALSATRRSIALRISSFCHGPLPLGPMNTAHVAQSFSAVSQGLLPGLARHQVPGVQPGADVVAGQKASQTPRPRVCPGCCARGKRRTAAVVRHGPR